MKFAVLLVIGVVLAQKNSEFIGPEVAKQSRAFPKGATVSFETLESLVGPAVHLEVTDQYTDAHNGMTHIWTRQVVQGLSVQNAVGNLNVKEGSVVSNYDRFTTNTSVKSTSPTISAAQAVQAFSSEYVHNSLDVNNILTLELHDDTHDFQLETTTPFAEQPILADLMWLELEDGHLELIWQLNIDLDDHWYEASISAVDGKLLQLYDLVHYYDYDVFPLTTVDPEHTPALRQVMPELFDPSFSPVGWHDWGQGTTYTNTQGNNVRAQENLSGNANGWENNYRPTAIGNDFIFPLNLNTPPDQNLDAAITSLFYHNNLIHDIMYVYGFDEISGNFQFNNFGRGGRDGDPVTAHAQDGSGSNNANFATPADGSPGRMRMYTWNAWNPNKDGDFDSGIIYHEYAHGISNRLTGGPTQTGCLGGTQPGGMGEGWGDFIGLMFRTRPDENRFQVIGTGTYVVPGLTIRNWPYSSDQSAAPQTYTYINGLPIHQIGCVWATILYEVYWNLNDRFGFNPDWLYGNGGNNMMAQLLIDGMKLQPCRPNLVDARDAIIDAAEQYGQEVVCLVWQGFASRGMGTGAQANANTDSFTVPAGC